MRASNLLTQKPVYEFDEFRLDTAERVLLKAGLPLSLFPKSLDVLIVLIENRGHIVEKDELIQKVWPSLFVEDNNLSFNISVLRKVLGDSPAKPRYIETVTKRGYRFVGTVQEVRVSDTPTVPPSPASAIAIAKPRFRQWYGMVALILAIASVTASLLYRAPKFARENRIILADLVNKTGDPVFDGTLNQGLALELAQSRSLIVLPDSRIRRMLGLMGKQPDSALTITIARDICERAGGDMVLEPSIASFGSEYALGLVARKCNSGDVFYTAQMQAARKESVLNTLNQLAHNFRARIDESAAVSRERDTPLAEATTPSLVALKAYTAGWKMLAASGPAAALPLFQRATEIDPSFAMAYAYLGRAYADIGESVLAAENSAKAYQLRTRTTDRERFFIDASYNMQVTGNIEKAEEICELWARAYPHELDRDMNPYGFLAGIIDPILGKYERALAHSKKMLDLDPDFAISYNVLALSYQQLNRLDQAEQVLDQASARHLELPDLLVDRHQLAFLESDHIGMEQAVVLAKQVRGAEDLILHQESLRLAYHGQLQQAEEKSKLAKELTRQSGQREKEAIFSAAVALRESFFENAAAARQNAFAALQLSKARDVEYGASLALALAGDSKSAQTVLLDVERRFPDDTVVRFNYLPTVRASLALNRGEPEQAINILQAASSCEFGTPPSSFLGSFGALYPIYVRGEAYLAAKRGDEAAKEFQKILDHRVIVVSDPIGALAHLQLGRAFALNKENGKAKTAFADFFLLWKEANANIPLLNEAKREYARMQ